ncbi:hypothetical protein [Roseibium sp.]|uniref:hypothetical protein n=1 Tax=Roseibium sp. TaxID=1936156 RepID=UPI003B51BD8A
MLTRPATVFTELGTKVIEKGLADPRLSEFYETFMSAPAGAVQAALKPHMNYLSLCSDKVTEFAPPPIFYVGKESSQRLLFGDDWANPPAPAAVSGLRTPDADLERASVFGYNSALNQVPYYGYARTLVNVDGQTSEVAFERLIVSFCPSAAADFQVCAYFGVIQDLQRTF